MLCNKPIDNNPVTTCKSDIKKHFPNVRRLRSILRKNASQVCEDCIAFFAYLQISIIFSVGRHSLYCLYCAAILLQKQTKGIGIDKETADRIDSPDGVLGKSPSPLGIFLS